MQLIAAEQAAFRPISIDQGLQRFIFVDRMAIELEKSDANSASIQGTDQTEGDRRQSDISASGGRERKHAS
jgi:hypothetical protein